MKKDLSILVDGQAQNFRVEVADTRLKRIMGLADRNLDTFLADAMLFVYESPTHCAFSMEHMLFPLTIAWFDEYGEYVGSRTVPAGDPNPVVPPGRFKYVMEFPVGKEPPLNGNTRLGILT